MKSSITEIQILVGDLNKNILGYANITINNEFVLKNIRIVKGEKGVFLGMPAHKNKNNQYIDIFFPVTKKSRLSLTKLIINEFKNQHPELMEGISLYGDEDIKRKKFRFK